MHNGPQRKAATSCLNVLRAIKNIFYLPVQQRWQSPCPLVITLCTALAGLSSPIIAEEPTSAEPDASATIEHRLDSGHLYVANSVDAMAAWLDRWLGGDDIDYTSRRSQARLRYASIWEEREPHDNLVDFRLKLVLPNTERRLKLFVSSETESFGVRDPVVSEAERESEEAEVALQIAGFKLGYSKTDYRLGLRSGARLRSAIRTRYLYPFNDKLQLKGLNEIYWQDQFGFGDRLRTELDYLLSDRQLLRWRSVLDFNEVDDGVPWESAVEWTNAFEQGKILTLYTRVQGQTRPEYLTESYGPGIVYRQSVGKPWFFVEGETRVFWTRQTQDDSRRPAAAFILRLELVFDESSNEFWH